MESMSHYRPMGTIRPEMHVMEAQRKDFMEQMPMAQAGFYRRRVAIRSRGPPFQRNLGRHRLDEDGSSQPQVLIGTLRKG